MSSENGSLTRRFFYAKELFFIPFRVSLLKDKLAGSSFTVANIYEWWSFPLALFAWIAFLGLLEYLYLDLLTLTSRIYSCFATNTISTNTQKENFDSDRQDFPSSLPSVDNVGANSAEFVFVRELQQSAYAVLLIVILKGIAFYLQSWIKWQIRERLTIYFAGQLLQQRSANYSIDHRFSTDIALYSTNFISFFPGIVLYLPTVICYIWLYQKSLGIIQLSILLLHFTLTNGIIGTWLLGKLAACVSNLDSLEAIYRSNLTGFLDHFEKIMLESGASAYYDASIWSPFLAIRLSFWIFTTWKCIIEVISATTSYSATLLAYGLTGFQIFYGSPKIDAVNWSQFFSLNSSMTMMLLFKLESLLPLFLSGSTSGSSGDVESSGLGGLLGLAERLGFLLDVSTKKEKSTIQLYNGDLVLMLKNVSLFIPGHFCTYQSDPNLHAIISNLSIELQPTQHLFVSGKSGTGKSTFLKAVRRLWMPKASANDAIESAMYLTNIPTFFPETSCLHKPTLYFQQNMIYPYTFDDCFRHYGVSLPSFFMERLLAAIQILELQDLVSVSFDNSCIFSRSLSTMSTGELQRLALARVILWNPSTVLLDEAISGLSRSTRTALYQFLFSKGIRCIIIDHDVEDILRDLNNYSFTSPPEIQRLEFFSDGTWQYTSHKLSSLDI